MKRLTTIALVLMLVLSLFAGCRSRQEDEAVNTTVAQGDMLPDTGNMLPDRNDTIDPSNGANRDDTTPNMDTTPGTNGSTDSNDSTSADNNARGRNRNIPMH